MCGESQEQSLEVDQESRHKNWAKEMSLTGWYDCKLAELGTFGIFEFVKK